MFNFSKRKSIMSAPKDQSKKKSIVFGLFYIGLFLRTFFFGFWDFFFSLFCMGLFSIRTAFLFFSENSVSLYSHGYHITFMGYYFYQEGLSHFIYELTNIYRKYNKRRQFCRILKRYCIICNFSFSFCFDFHNRSNREFVLGVIFFLQTNFEFLTSHFWQKFFYPLKGIVVLSSK